VLGVDLDLFREWAEGQREMPPIYASTLAATLGVRVEALTPRGLSARGLHKIEPAAIWFKFRGSEFSNTDREAVLAIRRLGHNANQLEQATLGQPNRAWDVIFQSIMRQVDLQASPSDQARSAARVFCELNQFGHGGKGVGEILRGSLRSKGILLIESPLPHSQVEGCSFYVGDSSAQRPCIFVNTYKTTWFRRNVIIMHELGHALFDSTSGGQIDTVESSADNLVNKQNLIEVRAETFARETLLPKKLLLSIFNRNGLRANTLIPERLAVVVADSGVEKKTVIEVLLEEDLIDINLAEHYLSFDIAQELRSISDHALSTREYISKIGTQAAAAWTGKRVTTFAKLKLLLPVPYVKAVVEAVKAYGISISRGADLLMIDEDTFMARFPEFTAGAFE
jgi:Zn-dependent peptidase ImmA (M78 family)